MCGDKKVKQTFLRYLPVPIWQVVKSFEILIIPVLYVKTHMHADFL